MFGNHLIRLFYEAEGLVPSDEAERSAIKIMRAYLDAGKDRRAILGAILCHRHQGSVTR